MTYQWLQSITAVFRAGRYQIIAIASALLMVWISFTLTIKSILSFSWSIPTTSFGQKILLLLNGYGSVPLNLPPTAILFVIFIAALTGINIALAVYYLHKRARLSRGSSLGFIGMLSAILGVGCASCGSVLLSSFIGLSASAAVIGFLPLRGAEFSILAIGLLGFSIITIAKKILPENIAVCKIKINPTSGQSPEVSGRVF